MCQYPMTFIYIPQSFIDDPKVTTQHPCLNVRIVSTTKNCALRNHKTDFAFFQYL